MTAPATVDADLEEIDKIEEDLQRRLDMVADDDDLIVLLGMAAAGEVRAAHLSELVDAGSDGARSFDLARSGLPADKITRFQQLWYHFKVPFAEASLVWWYLFCLNLGRDGDIGASLIWLDQQLSAIGPNPAERLGDLADLLGQSRGSVVITDDESGDVDALLSAVKRGVPMVWTDDIEATAAASRIEEARPLVGPVAGKSWWLGPAADLTSSESRVRARWSDSPETERDELLAMLEQKVTSIERMRFRFDESITDNKGAARILSECRSAAPAAWPYGHLVLATTLWCWFVGGFTLQELNQSFLSLSSLTHFLLRRIRQYAAVSGQVLTGLEGLDPVALAGEYAQARTELERTQLRCMHFDGSNWERREFLLPKTAMDRLHDIPDSLRRLLGEWTGLRLSSGLATRRA